MNDAPSPAESLFLAAVQIAEPQERTIFLGRACGDDRALLERVEGLLASHEGAGDFLAPPAASLELEAEYGRVLSEEAGQRIGNYKLLQQIGEGGFGVVWMAEQEQPVRRRVALKIIKPGMDTREVIARFGQERQALAMMDHPHIAKVFDAGATQSGRPFFVMELVRGVKITDYCDQANLPMAERLQLFIAVCHAVQHAHQKGIIHRDLKPSNILVTLHDGVPVPKVIDFGVAKATQQQQLTGLTLFTQFEQMIGTPLYMSPEQAEMSGLDVDTRTDIYSLGVLLYELLTGQTPFDPEQLRRAGHDEIRRVIREQDPPKPSTALSTMAAARRMNVAQHRHSEVPKLINLLCGDLDWIVMKALEKDRTRRYDTANDLARDINRHLSDEPVLASPPGMGYLLLKFVRRHRTGVSVGLALALTVLLGAGVSLWQAVRANKQAELAEERRQEADASSQVAAAALRQAELSAKEVTHQLAGHCVNNGVQQLADGDYFGSWVWFANALRVDEADAIFAWIHRLRLGALSRACPAVLQVFSHNGFVLSAEFSRDGRRLVTASLDKTARIWDVNTGAPLIPPLEHAGWVTCASFSPDGQRVVTGCYDKTARIWSAATGAPLTPPMLHEDSVGNAAFSQDGRRLITVSADQTTRVCTRVWDATTGQPLTPPFREEDRMWVTAFSPDSRFLVTGSSDKSARIWDAETGHPVTPALPHAGKVGWAAFSPDGKLVATASEDLTARIWDAQSGAPVTPPLPHSEGVTYVAFSPDGHQLVTASGESALRLFPEFGEKQKGEARVWDVTTGKPLTPPMAHKQGLTCVAFSHDGRRIVSCSWDQTARVWDATTGEPMTPPLLHNGRVWRASFSPDGRRLVTACFDHTARIWDVSSSRITPVELKESRAQLDSLASDSLPGFSADGQRVIWKDDQGSGRVWNALSGTPITPSLHEKINQVIFSPDGRFVATAGSDRSARLWNAETGAAVASPMLHAHRIHHLAFSSDGQRLVTASRDQTARVWSVETGESLTPPMQHAGEVRWAAFSPDGLRVVTASEDKTARVWNASTGAAMTPPLPHHDGVRLAVFSPDSLRVVTASFDGRAQVWDADTGGPIGAPMEHGKRFLNLSGIESMVFSADGHRIVIADSTDRTARVWDADTGTPMTPPLRHTGSVPYAAFSHSGHCVVTVSADKTARVWDAASGQPITPPLPHDGWVDYAIFSADDRSLKTISHDRQTHVVHVWTWDLSPDLRTTKDLLLWAEMYSGRRFDASGALPPVDAQTLSNTWQTLQRR